ncbi:MAG: hypothetical protein ACI97A_002108 [Planctomycetota bacterium]|jgi:hypothetical protein
MPSPSFKLWRIVGYDSRMTRTAPWFFILFVLLSLGVSPAWGQDSKDSLRIVGDLTKTRSERRVALASSLDKLQGRQLETLIDLFWKAEILQSFLDPKAASKSKTLEGRLMAKPEFVRFLGAAFQHPNVLIRQESIEWSRSSTWPWLLRRRLRAYRSEKHDETCARFLDVIQGALKAEEMATIIQHRRGLEAEKGALFRLGLARAPRSQRVQAWPGARDWVKRGFSSAKEVAPYRLIVGDTARFPAPLAREAKTLLFGIRRTSKKKRGLMRVLLGETTIGEYAIGTSSRLEEIVEVELAKPISLIDQELSLIFDSALKGQVQFRAVVALEPVRSKDFFVATEVLFGNVEVSVSHGIKLATARTGGITVVGKEAHVAVIIPVYEGRARRIDLDHWSPSTKPGVWDVTLNGKPLVRLISQRLPRAAKCFPNQVKLAPGRNELIFTQVSGGELNIEAIRFVR